MAGGLHFLGGLARRYESTRRPGLALAGLIVLLYGWTAGRGFIIDDFRNLRLMREYREGRRATLELYRFLRSDEENRRLRAAGYYPWWLGDDVRYQHSRPLAERLLYSEYVLFGDRPAGYRLVGLAMYAAGVLVVLRLLREIGLDERWARWAALIFTVAAGHTVAVMFVSMHCDLLGLVLTAGSMAAAAAYLRRGGSARLATAAVLYALSLGAKESSLPVSVLPICLAMMMGSGRETWRRGAAATAVLAVIGAAWLAMYAAGGYGANNVMMLDPLRAPGHYLAELPVRAAVLLSTWLLPVNPFFFYLRPFGSPCILVEAGIGTVALLLMFWQTRRGGRATMGMILWAVVFLPLLTCTVPDDRNMLLPSMGFAMVGAAWMVSLGRHQETGLDGTSRIPAHSARLRRMPAVLFIGAQIPAAAVTIGVLGHMATFGPTALSAAQDRFGRPVRAGDCVFFVNLHNDPQLLFNQYCLDWLNASTGRPVGVRAAFLSDIREPKVRRVDEQTIRIEGVKEPLLAGFIGKMGRTRLRDRREGDLYDAGEFVARIVEMRDGETRVVEMQFSRPLEWEGYRFVRCTEDGKVEGVRFAD